MQVAERVAVRLHSTTSKVACMSNTHCVSRAARTQVAAGRAPHLRLAPLPGLLGRHAVAQQAPQPPSVLLLSSASAAAGG